MSKGLAFGLALMVFGALVAAFNSGVEYSRQKILAAVEEVEANGEDSAFAHCLVREWEKTGELRRDGEQ